MFDRPWHQVAFLRDDGRSRDLYSVKLDGSLLRRLTFNLGANYEPVMMPDGRSCSRPRSEAAAPCSG